MLRRSYRFHRKTLGQQKTTGNDEYHHGTKRQVLALAPCLDGGQRRHESVEKRSRASLSADAPGDRKRLAVVVEHGLDERLLGARPHETLLALLAEQQTDALCEQRLAGAGLAGDDVEPGSELEPRPGDQHEIVDRKLSEHGRAGRRAGGQKAWRARLKSFSSTLW